MQPPQEGKNIHVKVLDWLKEDDKPAGKFKSKKKKQFLCESDKVQLFSFSMRPLLNQIYMYIYIYIKTV